MRCDPNKPNCTTCYEMFDKILESTGKESQSILDCMKKCDEAWTCLHPISKLSWMLFAGLRRRRPIQGMGVVGYIPYESVECCLRLKKVDKSLWETIVRRIEVMDEIDMEYQIERMKESHGKV